MAQKKPLALYGGKVRELMPGDNVDMELDTIRLTNKDVEAVSRLNCLGLGSISNSVKKAIATSEADGYPLGFALEAGGVDTSIVVTTDGIITGTPAEWANVTDEANATGLQPAAQYYVSKVNPGKITLSPPSAPGVSCRVGRAISETELDINIEYPFLLS